MSNTRTAFEQALISQRVASRLLSAKVAMKFPTLAALDAYLKEHPEVAKQAAKTDGK
jgi:hypothetical protein